MRNPVPPRTKVFRCAIYTRKSSEEGLEQEFNLVAAPSRAGMSWLQSLFALRCGAPLCSLC